MLVTILYLTEPIAAAYWNATLCINQLSYAYRNLGGTAQKSKWVKEQTSTAEIHTIPAQVKRAPLSNGIRVFGSLLSQ